MYKRGVPCRCRACQRRRTLRQRPDFYKRIPRCSHCRGTLVPDLWRLRHEATRYNCQCSGYGFQHRRGSKWCHSYKHTITDDDVERRYGSVVIKPPPF